MSTARSHALSASMLLDEARSLQASLNDGLQEEDVADEIADAIDLAVQLAAAHALTASALAATEHRA